MLESISNRENHPMDDHTFSVCVLGLSVYVCRSSRYLSMTSYDTCVDLFSLSSWNENLDNSHIFFLSLGKMITRPSLSFVHLCLSFSLSSFSDDSHSIKEGHFLWIKVNRVNHLNLDVWWWLEDILSPSQSQCQIFQNNLWIISVLT